MAEFSLFQWNTVLIITQKKVVIVYIDIYERTEPMKVILAACYKTVSFQPQVLA